MKKFGAIGNWQRLYEKFDKSIIEQLNDASCVSAVGEMLANFYGLDVSQTEILENIGEWSNSGLLAKFLNSKETDDSVKWEGGGWNVETPIGVLEWLIENNKIGAMVRDKSAKGHAVFIDGLDEKRLVNVKDPFDQTRYKMKIENFLNILSEFVWRRTK